MTHSARLAALVLAVTLGAACGPSSAIRPTPAPDPSASLAVGTPEASRVHALVVSGGHTPADNSFSHLVHVERMVDVVRRAGVPDTQLAVFAGDGDDPEPDLSTGRRTPLEALLEGTPLGDALSPHPPLESSALDGVPLMPATAEALTTWFGLRGRHIPPGDTLVIYVTDHGSKGRRHPSQARIMLWGQHEHLTAAELHGLLERHVAPGVRVVLLMGQCYAGAFLEALAPSSLEVGAAQRVTRGEAPADRCGYFATTHDRQAYGCYRVQPSGGEDGLQGWSIDALDALADGARFDEMHAHVRATDRTLDVPASSSELWLRRWLTRHANAERTKPAVLVTRTLKTWPKDDDRVARHMAWVREHQALYGLPDVSTARARRTVGLKLKRAKVAASQFERAWRDARADDVRGALAAMVRESGDPVRWDAAAPRLATLSRQAGLETRDDEAARAALLGRLGAALEDASSGVAQRWGAVAAKRDRERRLDAQRMQLDARLAFLERVALAEDALVAERLLRAEAERSDTARAHVARLEAMRRCEASGLPRLAGAARSERPAVDPRIAWAPLADAVAAVEAERPPWVERKREQLVAGEAAPRTDELVFWRGTPPPKGEGYLLFFWATWCKPCKAAVPALMAESERLGLPIVSVTKDDADRLETFFGGEWTKPFPGTVARDPGGKVHDRYAAFGIPTIARVSPDGTIVAWQRGLGRTGLQLDPR